MARLIKVRIKRLKNSRTHTTLPEGSWWNVVDTYFAQEEDNTHYRLTTTDGEGKQIYLIWPVEDCEIVELTQRMSSNGPNIQHIPKPKIASDGGATGYYDLPPNSSTLYDLIEHKNMNFSEGNVFKAIYRMGDKEGIDPLYDWKKIKFCAEREIARLEKNK